jgi:predicted nucleic acid-binding protein
MGIVGKLREHRRIMVDTAPIIYFIEEHSRFGDIADDLFKAVTSDKTHHTFSSVVALIEVLIRPLRESDPELAEKYRCFFLHATNFTLYNVDPIIAVKAAELRATYHLRTPDAIQMAVGIENGGTLFITNDRNLKRVAEIEVLVLEDYL